MRVFSGKQRTLRGFAKSRDGNFAILTGIMAPMLALAVGLGANVAQSFHIRTSLRDALDAAVTSTARDLTTGVIAPKDARKYVEAFLSANSNTDFSTAEQFTLDTLVVDQTAKTIEASASAHVDLAFPFFSASNPRVSISSAAIYSDKKIEVVMMLDTTGSMKKSGKKDKIGDLQKAASNAVEMLLGKEDPKNPRVRVAIVPYAEGVNTGKLADQVFVETKGGSDLPPLEEDVALVSAKARPDNCATERKDKNGKADFSADGPSARRWNNNKKAYLAKINRDDRLSVCPQAELVALTGDKQKLLDTIANFKAAGVTAGGIAAQWGYYMLSPDWRSAIAGAGLGAGPADYNAKKVSKVAILMTDGQFNTAFAGVKDGDTPQNKQGAKSRSYAESLCGNMKTDGIELFTIGFDLNDPTMTATERDQAKTVLKNCSSPDTKAIKHYFEVSTGEELDAAFKEIIKNTERLALTK
jgi:Flp pilus assembly protein TadG